ncbi:MAG: 50S ribosomal protein L9 [Anaerolineaceae bacterium]|nr:50S ribosomal protein L9 [Anaerolineaceae bacterium]
MIMKVLLLKDVHKLGRAGDIKKVANGYGRNYLIPQQLAMLATQGAIKMSEQIRVRANEQRQVLNKELGGLAAKIAGTSLPFASKAGETEKLYGSITTQMIADALSKAVGTEIDKRIIDSQPLRTLGIHFVPVRLTVDMIPEVKILVYREGESPEDLLQEDKGSGEIIVEDETQEEVDQIDDAIEDAQETSSEEIDELSVSEVDDSIEAV